MAILQTAPFKTVSLDLGISERELVSKPGWF
jgi:hypothetical protein